MGDFHSETDHADGGGWCSDCQKFHVKTVKCAAPEDTRLREALHTIAYEPIGGPEDSAVTVLANVVEIARDALRRTEERETDE